MTETQDWKEAIAPELTPLEQLTLEVAARIGWENIRLWNDDPKTTITKKTFIGENKQHPELGIFVPNYAENLDAITFVFRSFNLFYQLAWMSKSNLARANDINDIEAKAETEAIALCKLLLRLAPKPEPQVQIIDDDGGIDEPTVIEAMFG